jgi:hypothetical protein
MMIRPRLQVALVVVLVVAGMAVVVASRLAQVV